MSRPVHLRAVPLLLVVLLIAGGVAAHASDEPPTQREWWRPVIAEVFSKVRSLFLPYGQEIDPNGGHATIGGTPTPQPGISGAGSVGSSKKGQPQAATGTLRLTEQPRKHGARFGVNDHRSLRSQFRRS